MRCPISSYREEDGMDRHRETPRVWSSYLESMVAQTQSPELAILCRFLKCFKLDPGFDTCFKPVTQFLLGKPFCRQWGLTFP